MGTTLVEALDTAISDVLDVDPDTLTDPELNELVVALQRHGSRLAALRARMLSAWDSRGVWAGDGSRSPAHRLAREASLSVRTAKVEITRARGLRSMPHTAKALENGSLSPDHVDLLARANNGSRARWFAGHEQTLVEQCQVLRFADAYRTVEYWRQRADAEATEEEGQLLHEGRHCSAATTLDGMVDLRALLDPIGGAAFLNELERLERRLYLQDKTDGTIRTIRQRRADALVEMAERSRTSQPGGLKPRPLITVLVGEETLTHLCQLACGTVVAPGLVIPLLSDADIERVVFDGPDRVIGVSRKRRFTGALRRAIEVRDRHCQHPSGCDEPADTCDVDHVVPYCDGGLTCQENGEIECRPHNRDKDKHDKRPKPPPEDSSDRPADPATDQPDQRPPPDPGDIDR